MESIKSENTLYASLNNCWDCVINYLDINSLFQLELTSKYFRNQIESFYETKERIKKINKEKNINKKNKKKKNYKHKFLSTYFNLMIQTSIQNKEFCNEETQKENYELTSMNLNKDIFPKTEATFFKNKNQIEQIFLNKNRFFILYSDNIFMIIEFDINLKTFKEQFNYDFKSIVIKNFSYSEMENTILFIQDNSQVIYLLNLNNSIYEIIKYENPNFILEDNITNIYFLKDFILFLNDKDEFYYFPKENFFKNEEDKKEIKKEENEEIKKEEKEENEEEEKEKEENEEKEKEKIEKPIKLEKTYKKIKQITFSLNNIILINEDNQLYSISKTEYKNQKIKNIVPNFKLLFEQKFNDFYTMNCSDNYFILLEKKKIPPFEEWKSNEISNWFQEMNLDDYLNIIKYKNITGRDIIKGGKEYLIDFMGVQEDHLNKINYEMSTIKNGTFKNMKLWGWGSNKNGQLGFVNYINFSKNPILINLPNLIEDDTIEKIFCGKTFSVLLSKFGNIFITGNYLVKDKEKEKNKNYNINDINNNSNNSNFNKGKNDKGKKNNKEKNKGKKHKKDFEKENIKNEKKEDENQILNDNRWVNISKDICYCYYNINLNDKKNENEDNENSYFQTKEIFNIENNLFFLGYYSKEIPFSAILKKPKFKHLKKGGKFITSTKVIEHIQEFLNDNIDNFKIVYGDSLLKTLESPLDEFIESEIPHHKIIQIKTKKDEIIWDRKKRYFKENFINENLNKIK